MVLRAVSGSNAPGRFGARAIFGGSGGSGGTSVSITTQLDALRIIQRTSTTGGGQGVGQASVPMALSFTGTQPIYCRRRSYSDGVTILQAPWLANASASSGTVTLSGIDVPKINADGITPNVTNDGWFYLDVATSAGGPWTNGTAQVTAGRLTAIAGQSLAVRMLGHQDAASGTNASLGIVISPYSSMLATYNDTRAYMPTVATMPWAPPADGGNYDSTFTSEFLRRQVQLFGCPAGAIGHAQGGTAITTYINGSSLFANYTQFAAIVAKAGSAWESQIWYQGHTEAGYGMPDLPYGVALTQVHAGFAALNTLTATKYVGSIPNITSSVSWGSPFARRRIRKAVNDWAAANSAVHVQISDLTQIDGIHENQPGAISMAQHFARATKTELSARGDLGPALVSATRSGTTITLNLSDVGQGTLVLTGTPGNRIHVFSTGRYDSRTAPANNRFPVSTVTVTNKTTLSIALANDPGDGQALDLYFYWANETGTPANDMIRDDIVDGDGITVGRQVVPNYASIQIAAPVPASTINAPPSGFISGTSPWNLIATSATYGTSPSAGFGQNMTGGSAVADATAPRNLFPAFAPFAVEFRFVCPPLSGNQVVVGFFGNSDFVGVNASGKIITNGAGTGTTTLVAGKEYAVCYQRGPSGSQLFLQNITDATAGVREINNATAVAVELAGRNFSIRIDNTSFPMTGGAPDEIGVFQALRYPATNTTYTAPTAPFTGSEPNLVALYHLDGDVTEAVCW